MRFFTRFLFVVFHHFANRQPFILHRKADIMLLIPNAVDSLCVLLICRSRVTRQNALDNNVSDFVTAEVSNGYQAEIVQKNAPYDIIFANILARPLIDMAPDLAAALKPGGYAVLSGFINDQEDWVVNAHTNQGLKLVKIYELDNWRAALMEKPQ